MTSLHLFQNTFIFRRLRVANFVDIIKIASTFIKITLKEIKKLKSWKLYIKMKSLSVNLNITKVADFW